MNARGSSPGTATIFLVDDDEIVRELFVGILEDGGYTVLPASHWQEALQLATRYREPIQLLVTDVAIPGMRGTVLAEHLLAIHPEMNVLFVSGYNRNAIPQSAGFPGPMRFLQKPFTVNSLLHAVRDALN